MSDQNETKDAPKVTTEQARLAFATKLESLRADRGWTQTELARRASVFLPEGDITRDRISKYAGSKSLPGKPHLLAIAKALNVEPDVLLPVRASRNALSGNAVMQAALLSDGMAMLNINRTVPWDLAVKIVGLIRESDNAAS